MTLSTAHLTFALGMCRRFLAPKPTQRVSEWVEQNIVFDEPKLTGPFSFAGREYLRECLDDCNDLLVTDETYVFGTGVGKTIMFMAGTGWQIIHSPFRCLWVMPATHGAGGAQNFSRSRLRKMILATLCLKDLVPTGARRHDFSSLHMEIGGSIIDFAGSNSPGQLAANRCDVVNQDEVDKFNEGTEREASASYLADERTKGMSPVKRRKASSPTSMSGLIWQAFLKTDQQRRFVPCPHCGKLVVLAWSKQFTVFPINGREAFVRWDKEAKRADGTWDLDRVVKSARFECPHCAGHILDGHKTQMDRNGVWEPTATGAPGHRGRHLPSMYAPSVESQVGQMAKKFLTSKNSLTGLQGFINSDLAEPYLCQDTSTERIELITSKVVVTQDEWVLIMRIDCQQKAPYFWWVIRAWSKTKGECHGVKFGSAESFEECREIQVQNKVADAAVFVDSGWRARSGEAEVYRNCAQYCEALPRGHGETPILLGWTPTKGFASRKRWRDKDTGVVLPYHMQVIDPFLGTVDAGKVAMNLFEYSSDFFKDILTNMRAGRGGFKWSVSDSMNTPEYWKHMDGEHKATVVNKITGYEKQEWRKRHKDWPNHGFDCETGQVADACMLGLLSIEEVSE